MQFLHPPQILTSGKCHKCNNSWGNKSYWMHRVSTVTYIHQSQPSLHLLLINFTSNSDLAGARCSSVVRASAYGAMNGRINPSRWTHWAISRSNQCYTTGFNKCRGMCYHVCGMVHIKEPLLLIGECSPSGGSGFPLSLSEWSFTISPTPYNSKNKMCWVRH